MVANSVDFNQVGTKTYYHLLLIFPPNGLKHQPNLANAPKNGLRKYNPR